MFDGINNLEYCDYLKYYSSINNDVTIIKKLYELGDEENKVININLNLFLRILGATNEIINDDFKTLQFMIYIKVSLDEAKSIKLKSQEICNESQNLN
jgi:hypothetical protein